MGIPGLGVNCWLLLAPQTPLAVLWESVDLLVACLPFKAICTKFGELTCWSTLAKSSANTLAGEVITVIVEIELMGAFGIEVG